MLAPRWNALRAWVPAPVLAMAPDLQKGLRAAIATLGPFLLVDVLHDEALAWTALGGWLGTLADPGGTRAARAQLVVAFGALGALAIAIAEPAAGHAGIAAVTLGVGCFGAALLGALGAPGATLGTLLAIVIAIAVVRPSATPLRDAAFFAAGSAQALLLSTVVWPIGTHVPLRRAVARVQDALAAYADALREAGLASTPDGDAWWSTIARTHRRACRAAIEDARAIALALRARRAGTMAIGSGLRALLGTAEQELALLVTLGEEIEAAPLDARGPIAASLARAAETNRAIASSVARGLAPEVPPPASTTTRLDELLHDVAEIATTIDRPRGAADPDLGVLPGGRGVRATLIAFRDALSPRSIVLRHAVRVSCAAALAAIIGRYVSPAHAHWVAVTTIVVLQPYPGATWKRALERVAGSVLGSVVAVAISLATHDPRVIGAIMFPLSVAAVATRPRSYRLFTFFITPVFVLLAEQYPGDWHTALARAADAALGGLIGVVAAFAIAPSWERERMPDVLASTVRAVATYARATFDVWVAPRETKHSLGEARRTVAIALANAETALERLLAEPRRDVREASLPLDVVTYARRISGAMTALASTALDHPPPPQSVGAIADYVVTSLERIASALEAREPIPALPPAPSVDPALPEPIRARLASALRHVELLAASGT
ncbi:FUSC family protein [Sandaracinus amylolyticus]|uniref:FUSC family protein n=1 Tax=Sandaracinus amylolyticus TaxID=927083 RepID=UPI001F24F020|nr:FUSC family protein [Sandaracinus amylolyticus]UJR81703.1 FUSC-like domain-containing protein [Sandaracinus amylolyticus]